ncbi:MAG: cobalamin-binding protein [Deltaproteobacteria bacterium]|nr:MAG: cobalamin-binding protein [Deltaproteobacteria bacterium]
MSDLKALNEAVIKGDIQTALMLTQNAMDAGKKAHEVLDQGLIAAMDQVGDKFAKGEMFVPQMLRSAKAMQECVKLIKPQFQEGDFKSKGKVVIGTVKGDLHDIGKNLVSMMMEGAGFTMMDLGVDVSADTFLQKVQEVEPDILAMSALLSTTMPGMRETIETLRKAGIKDKVMVMIGGAPVTANFASEIKADAYAPDAGSAVIEAKKVLGIS